MEDKYTKNRNRRVSNRRYPSKPCKKPDCSEPFTPHDAKQKYCCEQHRIDHNNDLRKERNKELNEYNNKLLKNEAILKKMYERNQQLPYLSITYSLLEYEDFDFDCNSKEEVNVDTKAIILWSLGYGIESKDATAQTFMIHKKENK